MRARGSVLIFIVFYTILNFIVYAILIIIVSTDKGTLFDHAERVSDVVTYLRR